jgi:hypothetical protein
MLPGASITPPGYPSKREPFPAPRGGGAVRATPIGYDPATIRQAVREASPDLEVRKPGHVDDYVRRTVEAAIEAQARRLERERSRDRDHDLER